MRIETQYENISYIRTNTGRDLTLPCIILCTIIFLVLGILPIIPSGASIFFRPIFIFFTFFAIYKCYPLHSAKWQLFLFIYFAIIFICNNITKSSFETFISHELFILFFILASGYIWSRREINLLLETTIIACSIQALVCLLSNSFLLHIGGQQHINYLWISANRNPIAFAIVPGAIASLIKLIYCRNGWRVVLPRIYWSFAFLLCFYSVFAIGCRSAFYSLVLGIGCLIWERVNKSKTPAERVIKEALLLISVLIGFQILFNIASGAYSSRLFSLKDTGREDIWNSALNLIRQKPVFGGGYDYWDTYGPRIGTHNTFITFALTGGVIAVFFLIGHLFSIGFEIYDSRSLIPFAFFIEAIFHTFTESSMDYYAYLPLIICMIIVRYIRYQGTIQSLFND